MALRSFSVLSCRANLLFIEDPDQITIVHSNGIIAKVTLNDVKYIYLTLQ